VAPLLLVGVTSLICISTPTSDVKCGPYYYYYYYYHLPLPPYASFGARSFYTRLFKIKDTITGLPVFAQLQVSSLVLVQFFTIYDEA
jgi:hypothetical protein